MENIIKVTIEIPKNSNIKYEYNRKEKCIEVDRILRDGFRYPTNYGFIPNTLDWDGDELDVLVYSEEQFIPGIALNARIIGAMKMIDSGEIDTKLIAVHQDDYRLSEINNLNDLPNEFLKKVEDFFTNYKNWKKPNLVQITGFEDIKWALSEYKECKQLMAKYGELDKKNFIDKMKTLYPEKYKE